MPNLSAPDTPVIGGIPRPPPTTGGRRDERRAPRAAPAASVGPKSRSGSACIHSAEPVGEREEHLGDHLRLGGQRRSAPCVARGGEQPGQVAAHAPVQLAPARRRSPRCAARACAARAGSRRTRALGDHLLQRLRERAEQRVGARRRPRPSRSCAPCAGRSRAARPRRAAAPSCRSSSAAARARRPPRARRGRTSTPVAPRAPTDARIASTIRWAFSPESSRRVVAASIPRGYPAFVRLPRDAPADPPARSPSRSSRRPRWCPRRRPRRPPRPAPTGSVVAGDLGIAGRAAVEGGGRDDARPTARRARAWRSCGPRDRARLAHRRAGERARHGARPGRRAVRRPRHRRSGSRGPRPRTDGAVDYGGSVAGLVVAGEARGDLASERTFTAGGLTVTRQQRRRPAERAAQPARSRASPPGRPCVVAEVSAEAVDGADPPRRRSPRRRPRPTRSTRSTPDPDDATRDAAGEAEGQRPRSGSRAGASSSRSTATCAAPTTSAPRARSAPTRATTASPRSAARCSPSPTARSTGSGRSRSAATGCG